MSGEATGMALDDAALRTLLSDAIVTPGLRGGLDDGPVEVFGANGFRMQNGGHGCFCFRPPVPAEQG